MMDKKFNKFRKGKKPSNKTNSKGFKPSADKVTSSDKYFGDPINDIKWYRENEQLLNDVSRIAYNIPVGLPFARIGNLIQSGTAWAVPGIAVMDVVPTFGRCGTPSDPVNVAFNGMFTFIRAHTSSKFDWDPATLGINTMATDSLYYMVKWYTRLYSSLPLFHQSNKYLCRALIEAQGVDYDDLLANAAQFRADINMRIARINALKIPSEVYVFARHQWLFENYYIEGACTKDQIYCYRPAAYYVHSLDSNGLSQLECHRTLAGGTGTGGRLTTTDLIRKLDTMLNPIFNDQYFNLISGYIEQAYEGKVMHLGYLLDQMVIPLIYSEEVLLQFKNAKMFPVKHASSGPKYADGAFDVIQGPTSGTDPRIILKSTISQNALMAYRSLDDGTITYVDSSSSTAEKYNMFVVLNEYSKDTLITSPHADVTPEENMINTRLIPITDWSINTAAPNATIAALAYATEWPIEVETFTYYVDPNTQQWALSDAKFHTIMYHDTTAVNAFNLVANLLPLISKFKFFPELRIVARTSSSDDTAVVGADRCYFELDNYATVKRMNIQMMHQSAALSMLRVPEIASTNLSAR